MHVSSICCAVTETNKSENQDACRVVRTNEINALVVADGLGSYSRAKDAANIAADFIADALNENGKDIDFEELFENAKNKVRAALMDWEVANPDADDRPEYGTTLICLVETENSYKIAYTGNGGIFHIRGLLTYDSALRPVPWDAVNYLNPHSMPVNGKEALYRLISSSDDYTECQPTVFEIAKDKQQGDIWLVCTDGIFSPDQVREGNNSSGRWAKVSKELMQFFETLHNQFHTVAIPSDDTLKDEMQNYLSAIKAGLEDDATIGVLISDRALKAHKHLLKPEYADNTGKLLQEQPA